MDHDPEGGTIHTWVILILNLKGIVPTPSHPTKQITNLPKPKEEEAPCQRGRYLKLKPPTFVGKVNRDAYIEWERWMEYIFDYYNYSEAKKITIVAAQMIGNALAW
ncbi:hypothetical protein N665_0531s0005 [Sinapis alba]|nr:hypothetical protein N665_0531s0005 [Sinapis alba]